MGCCWLCSCSNLQYHEHGHEQYLPVPWTVSSSTISICQEVVQAVGRHQRNFSMFNNYEGAVFSNFIVSLVCEKLPVSLAITWLFFLGGGVAMGSFWPTIQFNVTHSQNWKLHLVTIIFPALGIFFLYTLILFSFYLI